MTKQAGRSKRLKLQKKSLRTLDVDDLRKAGGAGDIQYDWQTNPVYPDPSPPDPDITRSAIGGLDDEDQVGSVRFTGATNHNQHQRRR